MTGNKYGAVVPLVKDSAWWSVTDITLYEGEIAWELKTGGAIAEAYMLRGDGNPANPNYTRMRVSGDNIQVTFNGGKVTINAALQTITQQYTDATAKYNQIIAAFQGVLQANTIQANSISFPNSQGSNAPTYINHTKVKSPRVETGVADIQTANIGSANVSGNAVVQGTLSAANASITTAAVSGNETVGGALNVTGKITGNAGLEVTAGQTTLKNTQVNGTLGAQSAAVSGNETVGGALNVTGKITGNAGLEVTAGQTTLKNTQVNGTLGAQSAAVSGSETVGGALNVTGKITGNAGLEVTAGQTTLKNTQVNGTLGAQSAGVSGNLNVGGDAAIQGTLNLNSIAIPGTANINVLQAVTAVLQSLETQAAGLHGVTIIDEIRTALIKNPAGQRVLLQWAGGNLTLGNLLDQLRLTSSLRPLVQDSGGTHEVAYLDDLVGNILFQFGVYSIGESQTSLPPVNPARPPSQNEKAIVQSWENSIPAYVAWNGAEWVYDSPVNKPDDYAWEWVVKHYRDTADEPYAAVFAIYSHEEDWSFVNIPLELYRPFAEQNAIDNNMKEWIRYAHNFIPDWLARVTPARITSADTGANGPGRHPPDTDKSGLIINKPPLLSDLYGMNIIDGGDEESEAFNQENWGHHAWGYIVDGGDETYDPVFRYHIDGGNERFLPFWHNRIYPSLAELGS